MGKMLGERLTYARVEKGMTVPELSATADISLSHIHRIEDGDREPSYKMLARLAEALDINVTELSSIQMMDKGFAGTESAANDEPEFDTRPEADIRKELLSRIEALGKNDVARLNSFVGTYFPDVDATQ